MSVLTHQWQQQECCYCVQIGRYATGYNFDGVGYIPFVGWATYYFFEGGSCTFWGIAITIIVLYWLELCIIHGSKKFTVPDKMSFLTKLKMPCILLILVNALLLVLLMSESIGYHSWISFYLYYQIFLFILLLYSSIKILKIVRHLNGSSRPIAMMTIWLAVSLGSWVVYDVVYLLLVSDLNEVGADGYIIAEGVQSVIWISSICFIDSIGSKGLVEPLSLGLEDFMLKLMTNALGGAKAFGTARATSLGSSASSSAPESSDDSGETISGNSNTSSSSKIVPTTDEGGAQ